MKLRSSFAFGTAKQIGLALSPSFISLADETIE